jgi:cell wall-associated NlpC family hydrolase
MTSRCILFSLWVSVVAATTGTVVVSSGNTLKVHSDPSTSSTTLYSLSNGAVVTLTCYTQGTTVSGSQGTTDQWDQIISSTYGTGYASHAYISSSGSVPPCSGGDDDDSTATAEVVVATGNTLKVHSSPSTSSSTLYSLTNGAVVDVTCVTTGDTISGSQGTTNEWFQIDASGYASAAYMVASSAPANCSSTPTTSTFQLALNYGMSELGTIYVGCAGGDYRFGKVAPYDMYHDGTTCGQSRVYFQPQGSTGFDCSGLMVQMFDAAGIYLPYQSSTAIVQNVPQVSKSSIQEGDMLAKSGHVVMWIGNNQVIESTPYMQNSDTSWTGTRVNSASSFMDSADYTAHRYPGLY